MVVHIDAVDPKIPFIKCELVIRNDQGVGFQKGPEAEDNPIGPQLDIAAVKVVVEQQEISDFKTGTGNEEFWRSNPIHGPTLFEGKGFAHQGVYFPGDFGIVVGYVNQHDPSFSAARSQPVWFVISKLFAVKLANCVQSLKTKEIRLIFLSFAP
jgi:hypothetical protein